VKLILSFIIFLVAGVFITYPWAFHLTTLTTGYGDNFIYAWIHTWIIESILSGNIHNIFTTNIFYPYQIGPASSDPNIITAIFSIIPYLITKEPIITNNFIVISSVVLTGFSLYLLAYRITKDFFASMFAGILVIFSPAYLSFYAHLQMLFIVLTPLSLLFFINFMKRKKTKHFVISLIFLLLQTYNNFLAGYFILFSYLIIFFFNWLNNKKEAIKAISKKNILIFIFFISLIIPIMIPYFKISKEFGYVRTLKDTVHFAIQPEDMLYSSDFSKLDLTLNSLPINRVSQNNEFKPGFLGAMFSILLIFSFIYAFKNLKRKNVNLNSFLSISILGFTLSLGPVLHLGRQTIHDPFIIPLPYALFYYLIPGFQGFRNSARWEMLFIIGAAVVIAIVLSKILEGQDKARKFIIYSLLILGCVAELRFPMKLISMPIVKDFPPEHHWLSTTPKDTIYLEMPVYNWNMTKYATIELWRLYYSTINYRRTMNGGGGFTPEPWQKMAYNLDETFPSNKTITQLKSMGLDYIIVHKDQFDTLSQDQFQINNKSIKNGDVIIKELNKNSNLKLIKKFGNTYVYEFNF